MLCKTYFEIGSAILLIVFSVFFLFYYYYFVEEDEEIDLQNQSLTPYPLVCPEFWRHYNYLKAFHDWHTGAAYLQQQRPDVANWTTTTDDNDDAYTAHVLNTIDEEETAEDDKTRKIANGNMDDGCDVECEVTVTVTLPSKARKAGGAATDGEDSPVDFWRQINDDNDDVGRKACTITTSTDSNDGSVSSGNCATTKTAAAVGAGMDEEAVVDFDISATVSADISRQVSEKDARSDRDQKMYKRTCTHSRLFDFLRDDDDDDDRNNDVDKPPSSNTSGYSSTATTPSARPIHESDSNRTEYDNYYNSWAYACPFYDGYDILPSKAFKSIAALHAAKPASTTAIKFKCPVIVAEEDGP